MERLSDSSIFQDLELVLLVFGNPFHIQALAGAGGLATKSYPTLETPWTIACQASLSMGFPRHEYWRGLPFPSPDLPGPGIEPASPALQVGSLPTEPPGAPCDSKGGCVWDIFPALCVQNHIWDYRLSPVSTASLTFDPVQPHFLAVFFNYFFLLLVYLFSCVVFMAVHGIFVEVHSLSSYGVWTAKS